MPTDVERSDLDRLLLSLAKRPINEIADETGMSPEAAAERLSYLLRSNGVLEDLYREQILIEDLWVLKDKLLEQVDDVGARNIAGVVNATRALIQLSLDRLDQQRERNRADIDRIDNMHAEVLGRALGAAMAAFIEKMGSNEEEAFIIMEEVLPGAFAIISENTAQ